MKRKYVPFPTGSLAALRLGGWDQMNDLARELWRDIPGLHRMHDAFAVMASGCLNTPTMVHGVPAVAGIDVLCREPRQKGNEPEGNAYHHVVYETGHPGCPYMLHYGENDGTVIGHWFTADMLHVYDDSKAVRGTSGVQQWPENDPLG